MNTLDLLKKYKNIAVPAISILLSSLFFYIMIITSGYTSEALLILLLPPVIVFLTMHYLDMYQLKKRLLFGIVTLLIIALIACFAYSYVYYDNSGVYSTTLHGGYNVTASVSPFSGTSDYYNYSFVVSNNTAMTDYGLVIRSFSSSTPVYNLTMGELHHTVTKNGLLIYYPNVTLPSGIYYYTFYINANNNSLTYLGPVTSVTYLYGPVISQFLLSYSLLFNLIFVAGVFVARSISHSRKFGMLANRKNE